MSTTGFSANISVTTSKYLVINQRNNTGGTYRMVPSGWSYSQFPPKTSK